MEWLYIVECFCHVKISINEGSPKNIVDGKCKWMNIGGTEIQRTKTTVLSKLYRFYISDHIWQKHSTRNIPKKQRNFCNFHYPYVPYLLLAFLIFHLFTYQTTKIYCFHHHYYYYCYNLIWWLKMFFVANATVKIGYHNV